ncbi:MAG: cupin domain-containing protein [Paenibacillaceae bacterium]
MQYVRLVDLQGEIFPAGRQSRILVGKGAPLLAEHFVTGHSTIFPGGGIPPHSHSNEEIYIILSGKGRMVVGDDVEELEGLTTIYIPPNTQHSLTNIGDTDLVIMYVYAPTGVVEHWEQERSGQLK